MVTRRSPALALLALVALFVGACFVPNDDLGATGEQRRVYFQSLETEKVFTELLAVGSRFQVSVQPVNSEQDGNVVAGILRSSDPDVLTIQEDGLTGNRVVEVTGPGEAYLEALDPDEELVDKILIRAAVMVSLELADGSLLGAAVDPRLPARFGLAEETPVFLVGLNRCGAGVLPVGFTDLDTADGGVLELEQGGANDWVVRPTGLGEGRLKLLTEEETWVAYEVAAVAPGQVDTLVPRISAFDEDAAQIWVRAFADNTEIVGLRYLWQASSRVQLRELEGPYNVASIAPRGENQLDAGPAEVEIGHEAASARVDLFEVTTADVEQGRVPPPDVAEPEPASGCESSECNPYAAAMFVLLGGRRLRRLAALGRPRTERPAMRS